MLQRVVTVERAGFRSRQAAVDAFSSPVPPKNENQLAMIIWGSRIYQDTVISAMELLEWNLQLQAPKMGLCKVMLNYQQVNKHLQCVLGTLLK